MKKEILIGIALTAMIPASVAFAAETGGGCGLGKVILQGKTGTTNNAAASFLNGYFFPPSFAMTTGTSGCDVNKVVSNDRQRDVFVAFNLDNLSADIAKGQGDYLVTLASVMGIADEDRSAFFTLAQSKYTALFTSSDTGAREMLSALDSTMLADSQLAKYVK